MDKQEISKHKTVYEIRPTVYQAKVPSHPITVSIIPTLINNTHPVHVNENPVEVLPNHLLIVQVSLQVLEVKKFESLHQEYNQEVRLEVERIRMITKTSIKEHCLDLD